MTELSVHRTRFADYTPSAVTSIAFSHRSAPGDHQSQALRCAVGRSNGDIEIWDPRNNWTHDLTLRGGKGRTIEGLAWSTLKKQSARLFSIGSSTEVTEWALDRLIPLRRADSHAGAIWSIAVSPDQESLAIGCDDGSLVIMDISGGPGVIEYKYVLARQKSRILSLAFLDNEKIVGGCSDSSLKIWDYTKSKGSILSRLAVDKVGTEATLVWAVVVLRNGTIVSGDSTGSVKFWDRKYYSLLQNFKMHAADVLCLGCNATGTILFSAGVDRKMHRYEIVDQKQRWAHIAGRHYHAHDVRAMATYESRTTSLVVTCGVDMSLAIMPIPANATDSHRILPAVPQLVRCLLAREARQMLLWNDHSVKIWQLTDDPDTETAPLPKLICKMTLKADENLSSVAWTTDGKYLTLGTLSETKLYMLIQKDSGATQPLKLISQNLAAHKVQRILFSEDGRTFVLVDEQSAIFCYELQVSTIDTETQLFDVNIKLLSTISEPDPVDSRKGQSYLKQYRDITISTDGSRIAVCNQSNVVILYNVHDGTMISTLPSSPTAITSMLFKDNETILLATASMEILEFEAEGAILTSWSKAIGRQLPKRYTRLVDHCLGMRIDAEDRLWLWGATWICHVKLNISQTFVQKQIKRKRNHTAPTDLSVQAVDTLVDASIEDSLKGKFWISFKYRSLLLFDLLSSNEIVVAERPLMDMLNSPGISPPFYIKKYGQA